MIRFLAPPHAPRSGPGAAAWEEMRREFAVAPPLSVHAAAPEVLAAAWAVLRETVLAEGRVPRGAKEAIAATVSATHRCSYCVEVHSMFARAAAHGRNTAPPEALAALVEWARACRSPGDPRLLTPPFAADQAPEVVGTAAAFTYINRVVTVLLDDSPFPVGVRFLRGPLGRIAARFLAPSASRPLPPGASLERLPGGEIPEHLSWAQGRPTIARAFAALGAATERAAAVLPDAARDRLRAVLETWHGEEPGFGRDWLAAATEPVPEAARPAARLAILVALAPARVTAADVEAFAATAPGDSALVALLSWSAFETTRRATAWLRGPF